MTSDDTDSDTDGSASLVSTSQADVITEENGVSLRPRAAARIGGRDLLDVDSNRLRIRKSGVKESLHHHEPPPILRILHRGGENRGEFPPRRLAVLRVLRILRLSIAWYVLRRGRASGRASGRAGEHYVHPLLESVKSVKTVNSPPPSGDYPFYTSGVGGVKSVK